MHSIRLNGWRRLGIMIAALWIISIIALTIFELSNNSNGIFVYKSIPEGIVFSESKITLPDGKVIALTEKDELKLLRFRANEDISRKQGSAIPPWEFDWSDLDAVPKTSQIRWFRFALVAVCIPLLVWLLCEALTLTISWIRRGFKCARPES